ncbi:MAG TPA: transcriptional regulator CynR [Caldilineaceae bacterium]|nr:transcriptional regulator CynR [Caldilineaceae bacterium]
MELRQLQYMLAVAEEGHFTRAAEKTFVSQPALSQQIQKLEEELGVALFDRRRGHIRLTVAGEILCRHARRILQEVDDARLALQELEGLKRGSLRVGVVQTVNAYLIPQVVVAFTQAHPAIRLHIEERPAGEIERGLEQGELQLGIGFVPPDSTAIIAEPLFTEEMLLVLPAMHPRARRRQAEFRELATLPMVHFSRAFCTRRLLEEYAAGVGIDLHIAVEMNTVAGILATVAEASLATVLPQLALDGQRQPELVGLPLVNPTPQRTVGLLWHQDAYRCAAARAFAEAVKQRVDATLPAHGASAAATSSGPSSSRSAPSAPSAVSSARRSKSGRV